MHKVRVRIGLISEAADGLVRIELTSGSRANWHFYDLKAEGFSTSTFEDFWIVPLGGDDAEGQTHDRLLTFLKRRGQVWDTDELQKALELPRHYLNRLGKDLAEHGLIDFIHTERSSSYSMRAKRRRS